MSQNEIRPPWITYPKSLPSDPLWRQEGEPWALHVWRPYWSQLTVSEREDLLGQYKAPQEWRDFYEESFQEFIAGKEGPAGWILRNNLTPCHPDMPTYTSVIQESRSTSIKKKILFVLAVLVLFGVVKYLGL
jgi:hypothetical protein